MIMLNEYEKYDSITKEDYRLLLTLLNPIAPHITEELNEKYNLGDKICKSSWPTYDEEKTVESTIEIAVSVNGKLRGTITMDKDASKEELLKSAKENENVQKYINDKEIIKEIVVPGKIVNFVIK